MIRDWLSEGAAMNEGFAVDPDVNPALPLIVPIITNLGVEAIQRGQTVHLNPILTAQARVPHHLTVPHLTRIPSLIAVVGRRKGRNAREKTRSGVGGDPAVTRSRERSDLQKRNRTLRYGPLSRLQQTTISAGQ